MIWGWMIPSLSQKWLISTNFVSKGRKKLTSECIGQILQASFFDKILALSNEKSTVVVVSGFFGCCIFTILFKYSFGCESA